MTTINRHIEDYLDYYCKLKYPPEYAVLLKGSWGTGKTWFIKGYCDKLEKRERKLLYVSLYGVKNIEEIDDALFHQLHPKLSSKWMAFSGRIIKGALKKSLEIDLSKEDIPDYLKNIESRIIIFDDLERCALSLKEILGYINGFVEHQELKVIIVANEDQLNINEENHPVKSEEEQSENAKIYTKIKEKLIGKTFKVAPDIDCALNVFLEKITDEDTKIFLKTNKVEIKEVFSISRYENLRLLKQALLDFERIFQTLTKEVKNKE